MNDSSSARRIELEDFTDSLAHFEIVILAVAMTTFCVVTITGNVLVLVSFLVDKKLRTLNNYFILSLAVSDTMIATFAMPLFTLYSLNGEWMWGKTLCDMWLAQDYMCSCASSMNVLVIALDRYFSVVSPLWYRAHKNGKLVAIMIGCVWTLSFLIFPPWIYLWQYIEGRRTVPEDDCYVQFLETNSYVTIITAAIAYYIPVLLICFIYFRIWRVTVKRKKFLAVMEAENNSRASSLQVKAPPKYKSKPNRSLFSKLFKAADNIPQRQHENDSELVAMNCSTEARNSFPNHPSNLITEVSQNHSQFLSKSEQSESGNALILQQKDNKAAKMLATILCAFIITTTPYNVVVVIKNFDTSRSLVPDAAWFFFYFMFYINSAINPVCYALANERFRHTYWNILKCSWRTTFSNNPSLCSSVEKKATTSNYACKTQQF